MTTFDVETIKITMRRLSVLMEEHRDRMHELDQAIGDGDLGLTMTRAFAAADAHVTASAESMPGRLLAQVGMAIAKAAPSTMGTLIATGFMRGGKAVGDANPMTTGDLATFFRAFTDGIMERGKTKPGNKTVVDALDPASTALAQSASLGDDVPAALASAAAAAAAGRDAARGMMSQHGKAAVFREQTIGLEDGGAYVGALVLMGFADAVA